MPMKSKYKLSDVLSLRINDEHRLEYLVNNLVIHTSDHKTVAYPLYAQAALYGSNAQLTNMKWVGERKVFKGVLAVNAPVSFHNFADSYSKRPGELQRFNTIGTRWSYTTSIFSFNESTLVRGVSAVIQPAGSIRDKEIIKFANSTDTILVFSKTRHFRH